MAIQFDSGEFLSRTANLPTTAGATICAWGYPSSTISSGTWRQFLSFGNTGTPIQIGLGNDNESGNNWGIVNSQTTAHASLGTAPGANVPFFGALVISGTGANQVAGYYRLGTVLTLASATIGGSTFTFNSVRVADSVHDGTDYWIGAAWNVKCWDRALTPEELLIESYFRRVMFPTSLNFHWECDKHTDLSDRSGNGRSATSTGTISTVDGANGLWVPRRKIFLPTSAAGAIVGSSTLAFSPSGTMRADGDLTGATTLVFSPAGIIRADGSLAGSATITFSPAGIIRADGSLVGSSTITFAGSATIRADGALVGASTLTFTATGSLDGLGGGAMIGQATLTFTPSGTMRADGSLVGQATLTFTPAGIVRADGSLAGQSTLTFSPSGIVRADGSLVGATTLTFTPTGVMRADGSLVGSSNLVFSASGVLIDTTAPVIEVQVVIGHAGLNIEIKPQTNIVTGPNEFQVDRRILH